MESKTSLRPIMPKAVAASTSQLWCGQGGGCCRARMALFPNKRNLQNAFGSDEDVPGEDDEARSLRTVHERTLGKRIYWQLRPLERSGSFPAWRIFPWGLPRDLWELISAYLSKEDMGCISLVSHDCRKQVWHTRRCRKLTVPEGKLHEALQAGSCDPGRYLIQDCRSVDFTVCPLEINILPAVLNAYSHVSSLTLRTGAKVPFLIPQSSALRSLSLALTNTPLPIQAIFVSLESLCLEVTRWRDPMRDLQSIAMQPSLQTLKLFVNNIGTDKSALDLNILTALHLQELRVVSYQILRPSLALPHLTSLTHLELHNFSIRPAELLPYTHLLHLRVSLLSMPVDVDAVLAELLKQNTSLLSFGLSWAGDTGDPNTLPFHCLSHAPKTLTRLSCAPVIDFRLTLHLTNLKYIDLRSCESSFSLARFTALSALQTLVLDDRPPFRTEHLSELRRLSRVLIVPNYGEGDLVAERIHAAAPQVSCHLDPSEEEIEW